MRAFFSMIYESWCGLYNSNFDLIFANLYDQGGYIKLGLTFFLIPLIFLAAFYFVWKYPYGKGWHWIVWLLITAFIVSLISYNVANMEIYSSNNQALNDAIADESTGYNNYAPSLTMAYALWNGSFAIVWGFVISLIMKPFSKVQIHLPF